MENNIKCPHCGKSYYMLLGGISTMCYYPPIYKNGVNVNPDRNIVTRKYLCLECHKDFEVKDEE